METSNLEIPDGYPSIRQVVGMFLIKLAVSSGLESMVMSQSSVLAGRINDDEEHAETHPVPWLLGIAW